MREIYAAWFGLIVVILCAMLLTGCVTKAAYSRAKDEGVYLGIAYGNEMCVDKFADYNKFLFGDRRPEAKKQLLGMPELHEDRQHRPINLEKK